MKLNHRSIFALLLAGVVSLGLLTACGPAQDQSNTPPAAEDSQFPEHFRPAQSGVPAQSRFLMPYMGLAIHLPESLQDAVSNYTLYMDAYEDTTEDGSAIHWAYVSWNLLSEEQKTQEIDYDQEQFMQWLSGLDRVGTLGIYDRSAAEDLDAITGCTEHQLLNESEDGLYQYYLSLDPQAPEEIQEMISDVLPEFLPREEFIPGGSAFDPVKPAPGSIGAFTTTDIYGTEYNESIFAEHELTLVNLFATWCNPCVKEIPELQELSETMDSKGVGVIGVVLDGVGSDGKPDEKAIATAKQLAERTGAKYPMLIPDETGMNGRLYGVTAVPESFFVDKDGNMVGDSILGARDLKGWTKLVEQRLEAMQK